MMQLQDSSLQKISTVPQSQGSITVLKIKLNYTDIIELVFNLSGNTVCVSRPFGGCLGANSLWNRSPWGYDGNQEQKEKVARSGLLGRSKSLSAFTLLEP
jgi:hypothetical protein